MSFFSLVFSTWLEDGFLCEDLMDNCDETLIVVKMDNGKILDFIGNHHVKYANVVSGGKLITGMVIITGGVDAAAQSPMIVILTNRGSILSEGFATTIQRHAIDCLPKDGWTHRYG